jgi:hypothetical protein
MLKSFATMRVGLDCPVASVCVLRVSAWRDIASRERETSLGVRNLANCLARTRRSHFKIDRRERPPRAAAREANVEAAQRFKQKPIGSTAGRSGLGAPSRRAGEVALVHGAPLTRSPLMLESLGRVIASAASLTLGNGFRAAPIYLALLRAWRHLRPTVDCSR